MIAVIHVMVNGNIKYSTWRIKMLIPEDEQDNVLHVYWVLLAEIEMTLKKEDALRKHTVSQAYDLLNRIGYTKNRPAFEEI